MEVNTEICRFCHRDIPDYSILTHEAHCERGQRIKNGLPLLSPEPRSPSPVVEEPSESSVITSPDDVEVATLDKITWNKKPNSHIDTDDESIPDSVYSQQSTIKLTPGQKITFIPIRLPEQTNSENWIPSWNMRSNAKTDDNPDRTLTNSPTQSYSNEPSKHKFDFINSAKIRTPSPKFDFNIDNPSYKSAEPKKQISQTSVLRTDYDFDFPKPSTSFQNESSTSQNGNVSSPIDDMREGFWETTPKRISEPNNSKTNNSVFDPGTSSKSYQDIQVPKRSSPSSIDYIKPSTHQYYASNKLPSSPFFGSAVKERSKSPNDDLSRSDTSDKSSRSTIIPITIEGDKNRFTSKDSTAKASTSHFDERKTTSPVVDGKGSSVFGSSVEEDKKKQQTGVTCPDCHRTQKAGGLRQHLEHECSLRHVDCSFCGVAYLARDLECHMVICGTRSEKCPDCEEMIMIKYKHIHLESNHGFIKLDDEPENLTSWMPMPRLPLRPPDILRSVPLSTNLGCRLKQQTSSRNTNSSQSKTAPSSPDVTSHSMFANSVPKSQDIRGFSQVPSSKSTSNKTTYDYPRHISPPVAPARKPKVVNIPTVLQHAKTEPLLSPTSRRKKVEVVNFGNVMEGSDRFKDNWKDLERRIRDNKEDKHVVIPCEYCSKMLKIGEVMSHQMMCFLQH